MKYKYLNKILLDWNSSKEEIQDNNIIKSSDIKRQIDKCFIYRIEDEPSEIYIFNGQKTPTAQAYVWAEYEKYKDKVYINGKHIELDNEGCEGWTIDTFDPGEYRVYIKDIDQVEDTEYMFYDCEQLVKAYIPRSATSIGNSMFMGCINLSSVIIPDSITKIGYRAFCNCFNLPKINIPSSVIFMGGQAFCHCHNLTDISFTNSKLDFINSDLFKNCSSLKNINLPASIKYINEWAFCGCENLENIIIPSSVKNIHNNAFSHCSNLISITIPSSVKFIGWDAFLDSKNIEIVYVKDINKFKQIEFNNEKSNPLCYGAKLVEI